LKGLRLFGGGFLSRRLFGDGNYRPDLKGLRRQEPKIAGWVSGNWDGNYRPDLKGLRLHAVEHHLRVKNRGMEITDLI